MTIHLAISNLYNDKRFNECIRRMQPCHLQSDLKQEVVLTLLEKPEQELQGMIERDELLFFAMRVVCTMMKSNRSTFARKYRTSGGTFDQDDPSRFSEGSRTHYKKIIDYEELSYNIDLDAVDNDVDMCPNMKMTLNGRVKKEQREDAAVEKIAEIFNGLYWYDRDVFLLYLKHGSFREMEKETRIPWQSTYKTVRKTIKKIKEHVSL